MEVDCNIKFFLQVYFREVTKTWLWFVLSTRKTLIFCSRCCKSNFILLKEVCWKILEWAVLTKMQQNCCDSDPLNLKVFRKLIKKKKLNGIKLFTSFMKQAWWISLNKSIKSFLGLFPKWKNLKNSKKILRQAMPEKKPWICTFKLATGKINKTSVASNNELRTHFGNILTSFFESFVYM